MLPTSRIHLSCNRVGVPSSSPESALGKRIRRGDRGPSEAFIVSLFCIATAIAAFGQTSIVGDASAVSALGSAKMARTAVFTRMHSFCSEENCADGQGPSGDLVQGLDGNFYGMTGQGGIINSSCPYGCGVFFKITRGGVLTTLYIFCVQASCPDGQGPGGLVLASDGNFYGVTVSGGVISTNCPYGCGTVFRITSGGALTTLHSFDSTDGYGPSGLIQGVDGNFYGTTNVSMGFGTLVLATAFKMTPQGKLTNIYSASNNYLQFGFQKPDGILYGTSIPAPGRYEPPPQGGTVFEMTPQGAMTTVYNFCSQANCADGSIPSSLVRAADGSLYGTTFGGGRFGYGVVFRLAPKGTLTILRSFCSLSKCVDGASPDAIVQATDGNFYGETYENGGTHDGGTLFEITPEGKLTTLYNFCAQQPGCADGFLPQGGLLQATNGAFYGTTYEGGDQQWGTIFRLSLGLGPFITTLPTSAKAGAEVRILGTSLKNATAVSFNGVASTFKIRSASEIVTTVPAGATTGFVTVTTPTATLSSNVKFRVP